MSRFYLILKHRIRRDVWRPIFDRLSIYRERWAIDRRKVDINSKCPGCGHKSGRIEFVPSQKLIVHHCMICRAKWGSPTVLPTSEWLR